MRRAKEQIPNPVKNQWEVAVEVVNQQSPDCGEKEYLCTRLVRMDQFIHNLGLFLCDSTGATGLPLKSSLRRHGDLRYPVRMASLTQPTPVLRRGEGLENSESFLPDK